MSAPEGGASAQGEQAAYWLRRCQGFRVESQGRRVGIVEDVLYGAEHDRPSALLVRTGTFKRRLEAISVDDVEAILPRDLLVRVLSRDD